MRCLETDVTLDDVLTILDEHYNNVKALDALNQELFQLQMGEKRHYQIGLCGCQDNFRFLWYHSWNAFLQTAQLS